MIIPFNLTPFATLILSAIFIFFFIKKWKKSKNSSIKLPPGPKPLPIIGNLHQISSLPFRSFRDLSKIHGPIIHLKLGSTAAVVVSSPEIAKKMLKDLDPAFAGRKAGVAVQIMRYGCADIAFSPYGDYWRQMRKICITQILSSKMVRSFRSVRRDEAARLVDSIRRSAAAVNLTERVLSLSSSITCRAALGGGVCDADAAALNRLMSETLRLAGGFQIADYFPDSRAVGALSWTKLRLRMMKRRLDAILDRLIEQHRRNTEGSGEFGGEDLVDVLLRVQEGDELQFPISNDHIKAIMFDMFSAGTDTSSTTIDWTMAELMRNPDVMARAQAEVRQVMKEGGGGGAAASLGEEDLHKLKYLKLVIKEALRLHPPVPLLPRACRIACEVDGYTIPAGVKVMVNMWAMHRDPRFWKEPEKFDPARFQNQDVDFTGGDFQYLPFGSGRRMCPGMMFGLATVELTLAQLLYNFDWKLPEGIRAEDLDMIENIGLTSSRKHNLFVVATPYQH